MHKICRKERFREFFIFFLTLKARNKQRYVVESYEAAESNLAKFDSGLVRDGKAAKEETEEFQKYNKNLLIILFYHLYHRLLPLICLKEGHHLISLERLSFCAKVIQEEGMEYI